MELDKAGTKILREMEMGGVNFDMCQEYWSCCQTSKPLWGRMSVELKHIVLVESHIIGRRKTCNKEVYKKNGSTLRILFAACHKGLARMKISVQSINGLGGY